MVIFVIRIQDEAKTRDDQERDRQTGEKDIVTLEHI